MIISVILYALWPSLDLGAITGKSLSEKFSRYTVLLLISNSMMYRTSHHTNASSSWLHLYKKIERRRHCQNRVRRKLKLCFTEETQKFEQLIHLSFCSGSQPRSMSHTGQQSTSSSFIFSIMHPGQTVKDIVIGEILLRQGSQIQKEV